MISLVAYKTPSWLSRALGLSPKFSDAVWLRIWFLISRRTNAEPVPTEPTTIVSGCVNCTVGRTLGALLGSADGTDNGCAVGVVLGALLGSPDGVEVLLGSPDGVLVGALDGARVSPTLVGADVVGDAVVGETVGALVGAPVVGD